MKLVSISRATGSKKKPESFNLPNTAGIMSKIIMNTWLGDMVRQTVRLTGSAVSHIGFTYP